MPTFKKLIGITIGDVGGIGPEITIEALKSKKLYKVFTPILIGPRAVWNKYGAGRLDITVLDIPLAGSMAVDYGKPGKSAGNIAYKSLDAGIKLGLKKAIDALVTAPISKKSFHMAGYGMRGHTEVLIDKCGVKDAAMLMACGKIFALLATRHIPLKDVSRNLNAKTIISQAAMCAEFIEKRVLRKKIRIAVAGFNPHMGEDGLLGREEERIVMPVVAELAKKGFQTKGPVPGDVVFPRAVSGAFDFIINLYHDQAMIPLKLIGASRIVNITLGLPFLRTSPGHGVGFDIAGRKIADPTSMIEALDFAVKYGAR